MPTLLKSLKQRFSRTRYLIGSTETALVQAGGAAREWLVARELCIYASIDCGHVPAKRRPGFVEIAVRRLAPFADPECHVVWHPDAAMVWIWSRARTMVEREGFPLRSDDDVVLPESVLLGTPQPDGAFLHADSAGCEGRVWRHDRLLASRWWPAAPDATEWSSFCRGAGLAHGEGVPEPAPFELQAEPWAGATASTVGRWVLLARRPLLIAAAALLAAGFAWNLGALVRIELAKARINAESAQLEQRLSKVLAARDAATRDAATADALLALRPPSRQIPLMARVSELLADDRAQLAVWSVAEGDKLAITLRMANPDAVSLVRRFEQSGLVKDVTSEGAVAGEITLRGTIEPDTGKRVGP